MSTYRTCAVTKQHSIKCLPTLKDGEAAGFKQVVGHRPFGERSFKTPFIFRGLIKLLSRGTVKTLPKQLLHRAACDRQVPASSTIFTERSESASAVSKPSLIYENPIPGGHLARRGPEEKF